MNMIGFFFLNEKKKLKKIATSGWWTSLVFWLWFFFYVKIKPTQVPAHVWNISFNFSGHNDVFSSAIHCVCATLPLPKSSLEPLLGILHQQAQPNQNSKSIFCATYLFLCTNKQVCHRHGVPLSSLPILFFAKFLSQGFSLVSLGAPPCVFFSLQAGVPHFPFCVPPHFFLAQRATKGVCQLTE